jgi:hypothetical protein
MTGGYLSSIATRIAGERGRDAAPLILQMVIAGLLETRGGKVGKAGKALQTANLVTLGALVAEAVSQKIPGLAGVDFTPSMGAVPSLRGVDFTPGMGAIPDLRGMGSSADFGANPDFGAVPSLRGNADFGGVDFTPTMGTSAHDGDSDREPDEGNDTGDTTG